MDENAMIQKIVGANIRKYRVLGNLTIESLAKFVDISPGFLGLIERGRRGLSFKNLIKLSEVLNVPIDLFFIEGEVKMRDNKFFSKSQSTKIKIIKKLDGLDERELHFILKTILSLNDLKNSEAES